MIKVGPGRREVTLRIRGGYVKVQDEITNEVIHVFNSAQVRGVMCGWVNVMVCVMVIHVFNSAHVRGMVCVYGGGAM